MKILSNKEYQELIDGKINAEEALRHANGGIQLLRGTIGDWRNQNEKLKKELARKDSEIGSIKKELEKTRKMNRHLEAEIWRMKKGGQE